MCSGQINRDNFTEKADRACQKAYCHEINFQRLDRAKEIAKQKGVTVTQVALAYVLNSPMNTFALCGAANKQEIEQCVATQKIKLSEQEMAWLS